jgi:hypothetical protein
MRGSIVMINDQEEERSNLNNSEPEINRGIELLLRNRRKRESEPKTFQVKFGKMISLFQREFHFFIEFHFDIRKNQLSGDE